MAQISQATIETVQTPQYITKQDTPSDVQLTAFTLHTSHKLPASIEQNLN